MISCSYDNLSVSVPSLIYFVYDKMMCKCAVGRLGNHLVLAPREISGEKYNMLAPCLLFMLQASQILNPQQQLVR